MNQAKICKYVCAPVFMTTPPKIGVERQRSVHSLYRMEGRLPRQTTKKKPSDLTLCATLGLSPFDDGLPATICGTVRSFDNHFFRLSPARFSSENLENTYRAFQKEIYSPVSVDFSDEESFDDMTITPELPVIVNAYALGAIRGKMNTKGIENEVFPRSLNTQVCLGVLPMHSHHLEFYIGKFIADGAFLSLQNAQRIKGFDDSQKYALSVALPSEIDGNVLLTDERVVDIDIFEKDILSFPKRSVILLQQLYFK